MSLLLLSSEDEAKYLEAYSSQIDDLLAKLVSKLDTLTDENVTEVAQICAYLTVVSFNLGRKYEQELEG